MVRTQAVLGSGPHPGSGMDRLGWRDGLWELGRMNGRDKKLARLGTQARVARAEHLSSTVSQTVQRILLLTSVAWAGRPAG